MKDPITTKLEDFGFIEREALIGILQAWNRNGLPAEFDAWGVTVMFNRDSGCVFLTNDECQTAMITDSIMHNGTLELWHNCRECGHEGFEEDCLLNDNGCNECTGEK